MNFFSYSCSPLIAPEEFTDDIQSNYGREEFTDDIQSNYGKREEFTDDIQSNYGKREEFTDDIQSNYGKREDFTDDIQSNYGRCKSPALILIKSLILILLSQLLKSLRMTFNPTTESVRIKLFQSMHVRF